MSERPRRMTQAERTARTRSKVLATAIDCLHTVGYAATTTSLVAQRSGSRGAMLHQFPTRADLMLAVVEAAFEEEMDLYDARFGAIADPKERVFAIPEAIWETLSRPAGVAVLEILQGSRSDLGDERRAGAGAGADLQGVAAAADQVVRRRLSGCAGRDAPDRLGGARVVYLAGAGAGCRRRARVDPAAAAADGNAARGKS